MLLLVSPARAAEHLPGRYIQLSGWDSHLGAGDRHSFLIPPSLFSSGQDRLPVTRKPWVRHSNLPDVSGRAPYPAPLELGCLDSENLLPTGSLLPFPLFAAQQYLPLLLF